MEFSAASAHRGLVSWLGLLLADFLLACLIPGTTAQFGIVWTYAAVGEDVILRTENSPPDVIGFMWYRGLEMKYSNFIGSIELSKSQYITGPEYSGRESVNSDGSLIIRKVTPRDLGFYILEAVLPNSQRAMAYGRIIVYWPVSMPKLRASKTIVTENVDAVVLTCDTNAVLIFWLYNARSLPFTERMKLSWDQRTLTIDPVRREDAGNYQCKVSDLMNSYESAPVQLDVKY